MNRLAQERSPYLLQHRSNPVDGYPWGAEAFDRARREDKPIFVSIGYSTCHWCHVMEHESFENAGIAELLNRDFVSVKVDRAGYFDAVVSGLAIDDQAGMFPTVNGATFVGPIAVVASDGAYTVQVVSEDGAPVMGASVTVDPWLTIFPSLVIFGTVLALNLLGDGLRAAFDPDGGRP